MSVTSVIRERVAVCAIVGGILAVSSSPAVGSAILTHTWDETVSPSVSESPAPAAPEETPAPDVTPAPEETTPEQGIGDTAHPNLVLPYCELEDGSSQGGYCYRFDGGSNGIGVDYIIVDGRTFYAEDGQ